MITPSEDTLVGRIVAEKPGRARIFEAFGLNYCCGGTRPLGEACRERGLDPNVVLAALHAADGQPAPIQQRDWSNASLGELIDHILSTHHVYVRQELPRLDALMAKTEQRHGGQHAELAECRQVLSALRAELASHMLKEEQFLFPAIRNMESAPTGQATSTRSVQAPIHVMEHEHESAMKAFARLRELTDDFTPPPNVCNTFRVLFDGLRVFEADLEQHIHKENDILFPRAMELEGMQAQTAPAE
jgi:regulator of cell morphogenesis and NO signaling